MCRPGKIVADVPISKYSDLFNNRDQVKDTSNQLSHQRLNSFDEIKRVASRTLTMEADAVRGLVDLLDDDFSKAVEAILQTDGRVVVSGIGKSANIANKMVATLNSTGTPAMFMHAADAIHGDLGMVQANDIVICLSKSGNTPEIKQLLPLVKSRGNQLVALCGNLDSYLAKQSDFVLNASVEQEACPNNLAPTTSTTAQLALGDALAVCLMHARGFSSEDFARYHPGGSLGKKLYVRVGDLVDQVAAPKVTVDATIQEVIVEISGKRLGATAVMEGDQLAGVITDGDLRRMLEKTNDLQAVSARDIMNVSPKTTEADDLAVKAFTLMEAHQITQLLVIRDGAYVGIIHLHDILKEGIY